MKNHATPTIQKQVVLPWGQVLRIAFKSLKVRLSRTLITTATLASGSSLRRVHLVGYGILNALWHQADAKLRETILTGGYELAHGEFGSTAKDRWLAILSLLYVSWELSMRS